MLAPRPCRPFFVFAAILCFLNGAKALDPKRGMTQYVREQWRIESGSDSGPVRAISQTSDGYLWIGTDSGLVRFDGFDFQTVSLSSTGSTYHAPVLGLATDVEGKLLVRLQGADILRQIHGHFEGVGSGHGPTTSHVTAMWSEVNGGVLLSDLIGGVLRFKEDGLELLAPHSSLPKPSLVISLAETPDGKIWMGTIGNGLSYLSHGQITNIPTGLPYRKINCLLPVGGSDLWVGTDHGLFHWNGAIMNRVALPSPLGDVSVLTMLRDRDSNVWVGTAKGLLRVNGSGISFSDEVGLRGDGGINALFEDREGNMWVGGALGLERIRDSAFVTYSPATGLPSENNGPIYADWENRIWFAPAKGGLYFQENGRDEAIRVAGLENDVVYSITGQKGHIWVGRQHGGLTHLQYKGGHFSSQTYSEKNGLAQNNVFSVYLGHGGTVWAGTLNAGVSRFNSGQFVTYTTANGLASNTVNAITETGDGTTWFGTPNGLSSFSKNHWMAYSLKDGLPSDTVNCLFEDSSGTLWIGTSAGLASLRSGRIQVFRKAPDSLQQQILGLVEDKKGWLWVATSNRVLRVRSDKLLRGTIEQEDIREYGLADGLQSTEGVNRCHSVVADSLGGIWFSMNRGLSVVDPSHFVGDSLPAIVHLEGISSDGGPIDIGSSIRIPPSPKKLIFRYTGLSLAVPERVRFRYALDGFESAWSQLTSTREAVYTNLGPGLYHFRIIASNSNGVWNGSETIVQFRVEPAYWQTWWFRPLCILMIGLVILTLFRLRVLNLTRQMSMRMEERLSERTRIARELHDSLLQGFQGLMFRLQAVHNLLPGNPTEARKALESALDRGDDAIAEGRGTVEDLRSAKFVDNDLVQALSALRKELAPDESSLSPTTFRVMVEGKPRVLDPVFRDETYRIAREALRNAFRHSRAQKIEAEMTFGESQFVLRIRDDGDGIDPKYLDQGNRAGHWGLPGMRERAKRLGGQLEVWSEHQAGTEVELTVPASVAYETSLVRRGTWFLRMLKGSRSNDHQL